MSKLTKTASILLAAGAGVAIGILAAPKSGKDTRKDIKDKATENGLDIDAINQRIAKRTEGLKSKAETLTNESKRLAETAKDEFTDLSEKAGDFKEDVSEKFESTREELKARLSDAENKGKIKLRDLSKSAKERTSFLRSGK